MGCAGSEEGTAKSETVVVEDYEQKAQKALKILMEDKKKEMPPEAFSMIEEGVKHTMNDIDKNKDNALDKKEVTAFMEEMCKGMAEMMKMPPEEAKKMKDGVPGEVAKMEKEYPFPWQKSVAKLHATSFAITGLEMMQMAGGAGGAGGGDPMEAVLATMLEKVPAEKRAEVEATAEKMYKEMDVDKNETIDKPEAITFLNKVGIDQLVADFGSDLPPEEVEKLKESQMDATIAQVDSLEATYPFPWTRHTAMMVLLSTALMKMTAASTASAPEATE
jgi:hypothetical protein